MPTVLPDWKTIESEVSGLTVRSVLLLGEGWAGRVYRVNDELVFKFPKQASDWEQLDREIAFLAHARPFLPVPVAQHLYQIRDSRGAPHGYAVYRCISGDALCAGKLSGEARLDVARTLARFLRSLHELRASPDIEPILTRETAWAVTEEHWRHAQDKVSHGLTASERQRLNDLIGRHLADPANFSASLRIIHADLSAEHILYANGAVTGILDWGEVGFGDPDYDFCYLYGQFGEAFVRAVASQYGHQDPDRLVRKARHFWLLDQMDAIAYGSGRAPVGDEAAAWHELRSLVHAADGTSTD